MRSGGILHRHHHHGGGSGSARDDDDDGQVGGGRPSSSPYSPPRDDRPDHHPPPPGGGGGGRRQRQPLAADGPPPLGTSLSGNFLLYVQIEEDVELDKDEMRALAGSHRGAPGVGGGASNGENANELVGTYRGDKGGGWGGGGGGGGHYSDDGTIGTRASMLLPSRGVGVGGRRGGPPSSLGNNDDRDDDDVVVDMTAIRLVSLRPPAGSSDGLDRARERLTKIVTSPPFRRLVWLGLCFALATVGVLLTLENFISVRTAEDWIEPRMRSFPPPSSSSSYAAAAGSSVSSSSPIFYDGGGGGGDGSAGGVDWKFGDDAPGPVPGSAVPTSIHENLADWAAGTVRVPASVEMDGYGSVTMEENVRRVDVPLFWGLPYAGGSIVEGAVGSCLGLVQASDGRGLEDDDEGGSAGAADTRDDLRLSTVMIMGKKYLNVDLSTPGGIARASVLRLGSSGMADVVHSPLLHEASGLFSAANRGRLFVVVRHPAEREFARFRYLRRWDHGKLMEGDDEGMSYAEFAESDYVADNWMTRTLVGKGEDAVLTAQDMQTAKEILRRKAVVGLYSDVLGAIRHYARYFGWDHAMNGGKLNERTLACFESAILEGMAKETYGTADLVDVDAQEGSDPWRKIMEKNKFDWELYVYSQHLYSFQIALS
ncbi:hypothetical protein ACHAW5_005272 [Stephanodiscus triporus]|uniref:Phospholipase B-like n=1 Tax=Stephanodiscus triporus TaxID=2934178 RepID=A0ABD3PBT5_9STRA